MTNREIKFVHVPCHVNYFLVLYFYIHFLVIQLNQKPLFSYFQVHLRGKATPEIFKSDNLLFFILN